LLAIAACCAAALLSELPELLLTAVSDAPLRPARLGSQLARWLLWGAIFGPLVYRFARVARVATVVIAALPVMLLYRAIVELLPASGHGFFQPGIVFTLTAGYGLLVQNDERRIAAERARFEAERRFSSARLELLRSELQPHFLFNALNTVSAMASRDPASAAAIAEKLRDLFRATSGSALPQVTTVEAEVAFTKKYLDIQQARFEQRLRTSFMIAPAVARARVPSLLMQPLFENAIRHGMTRREGVSIDAEIVRDGDELRVSIVNDGVVDERPVVEGVGLSNTRARLRALHGDAASFVARRRSEGGFAVEVRIPYDEEP
jgi:signal transduction histidine kinase